MENDQNNQGQDNSNTQDTPTLNVPVDSFQQTTPDTTQSQVPQQPQTQTSNQLQTQTQPTPPQSPPSQNISSEPVRPKSGKSDLLLKIGLILLAVAIIIGVASIFIRNKKSNSSEEAANVTLVPTQTIKNIPSPTTNPTVNWKAAATKYYTAKYPSDADMNILENTMNITHWGPTQTEATELFDGYSITFHPIETTKTPQEYANSQIAEVESSGLSEITKNLEPITIGNYEGVTYTEEGLGTFQQIILRAKNSSVLVQISVIVTDPGRLGFQETVDQILSTITITPGV